MQIEEDVWMTASEISIIIHIIYTKDKFHCFIDSFKILLCLVPRASLFHAAEAFQVTWSNPRIRASPK